MKKLFKFGLIFAAMASASLMAETYTFAQDPKDPKQTQVFKIDFAGDKINAEFCMTSDRCQKGSVSQKELSKRINGDIEQFEKLLSDKEKLLAKAKADASAKDAQIINDEAAKKKYVLLKVGPMNLPISQEMVDKGDFSIVSAALESTLSRSKAVKAIVDSGKAPAGLKTDDYSKVADVYHLVNLVLHSKPVDKK